MLGRLFHAASSSTATSPSGTRPSTSHAPEGDDIYTRNLLYPDVSTPSSSFHSSYSLNNSSLSQSSIGSSNAGSTTTTAGDIIDIDANRDVRVIIAQDDGVRTVLYDSKPSPFDLDSRDGHTTSPTLGGGGPYGRNRRRNPQNSYGPFGAEDEMRIFADCMFGALPLAYKGPSTKVHILPTPHIVEDRRSSVSAPLPPASMLSRRGSLRGGASLPAQQQSTTANQGPMGKEKRKSVLITRLFSVVMPSTPVNTVVEGARNISGERRTTPGGGERTPTPGNSLGSNHGFPFPKMGSNGGSKGTASPAVQPPKTSMYAIGLVISLPVNPNASCSSLGTSIRCCYHRPLNAYDTPELNAHRHEYCCPTPPSFDEDYSSMPGSFRTVDSGWDDLASVSNNGSMELITRHWDIITRALSDMQHVVHKRIRETLSTVGIRGPPTVTQNGYKHLKRVELRKMALMRDEIVRNEVERLRWRIVSGIKVPRVVLGQNRWDLWLDEAKWINARFGGKDRNFFFLTLLTAFLGHHTEWVEGVCPEAYRRRHGIHRAVHGQEESAVVNRTVILSNDKIAARRLIYLLSAFLPVKTTYPVFERPRQTSRSSSINYLSQSPPNFVGNLTGSKIGSLRKKAKRKPSRLNVVSTEEHSSDAAGSTDGAPASTGWDIPVHPAPAAASTVLQLPVATKSTRKSGTLTTQPSSATITTTNVTTAPESPSKPNTRPGSRDSTASINLMSTLKRTGTANTSVDSTHSGWGSLFSFWSINKNSQASSTATSEPDEHMTPPVQQTPRRRLTSPELECDPVNINVHAFDDPEPFSPIIEHTPLRCSVDDDGTVNVDVPLGPSFVSLGSPLASPPQSWATLGINFDSSLNPPLPPPATPAHKDDCPETGQNVVGYLDDERFHPDFVIQALRPTPDTEAEIRRAMHMEPTPHAAPAEGPWAVVSEVLIVDTVKLQIRRLRLRRRVRAGDAATTEPAKDTEEVMEENVICELEGRIVDVVEKLVEEPPGGAEGEVREMVMGALEGVVKEVLERREGEGEDGNVLTEGVLRWLQAEA